MMNMYSEDSKDQVKAKANGNTMPTNMSPNAMATFPGVDGKPASADNDTGCTQALTPVGDAAASPSASAAAMSPAAAPSFTVGTPGSIKNEEDDEDQEDKQMQDSSRAALPFPSASAPAAPKKQSMLGLPVLGSLGTVTGLLGKAGGA
ncbi:hypothetical protein BDW66DRAFT_25405 [Aspergillus desertorum]